MRRRSFLGGLGGVATVGTAGCASREGEPEGADDEIDIDGVLRVGTYLSMVDGEESAGAWIAEAFEESFPDEEFDWTVPEDGLNLYRQQAEQGADLDPDVYLGLSVEDLRWIDETVEDGGLFELLEVFRMEYSTRIRDGLAFEDPHRRVIPFQTDYACFVYDETVIEPPRSLEDLTEPEFEGALLLPDPRVSEMGRAFLLWTIDTFGEDGYLEYWEELVENDVDIRGSWEDTYTTYLAGWRPVVLSRATDPLVASREGYDEARHQVAFPDDRGYTIPEAGAVFEGTVRKELAYEFLDFVLSPEVQTELALRNARFPAVEREFTNLDDEFDEYATEPPEEVFLTYEDLDGRLDEWLEDWGDHLGLS